MKLRAFLLILLLSSSAFSIDSAQNTEYAKLKLKIWRDVSASSQLTWGTLTSYDLPQSSQNLNLLSKTLPPGAGYKTDTFGNTYLETRWFQTSSFPYQIDVTLESNMQMNNLSKPPPFPLPKAISDQAKEYLQPSYYSPITPALEAKALELTQGSKDSFEAVARLAFWLHNNIAYDATYGSVIENAQWVLDNKKGVCDEYAHTLISMARSVGIPARYVSGIAYGRSTLAEVSWQNHAWAEVYLGQWVPVDPTWGEIGWVDATHIKLAVGYDGADLETKFEWVPDVAKVQLSEIKYTVRELESRNFSKKPMLFNASPDADLLGTASSFRITASARNNAKGCIGEEAKLSLYQDPSGKPEKSFSLEYGQNPRLIMLCPGEEKQYDWITRTPSGLEEGYNYFYDTVAYDMFTDSRMKITADPKLKDKPNLKLAIGRTILTPGEAANVTVEADNTLNTPMTSLTLYAGEEKMEQRTKIDPGSIANARFTVKPQKAGQFEIVAYAPHNSASGKISVITSRSLSILSLAAPEIAAPGTSANASVEIENTGNVEQTVKLSLLLDSQSLLDQYLTLKPKEKKSVKLQFTIPPAIKLGNYQLVAKASSNDERSADMLVYENRRPQITPEEERYFSEVNLKIGLILRNAATLPLSDLKILIPGSAPLNISLLQPGAEAKITYPTKFENAGEKELSFTLEYRDQFKSHTEEYAIPIAVTEPNFLEKIIYQLKEIVSDLLYG